MTREEGSPDSTVFQVILGGHVDETVQGELVRDQLEQQHKGVVSSEQMSGKNQLKESHKSLPCQQCRRLQGQT